ncbi:MAG: VRR-NUC domain-containing protein [Pseudomonadota bacterium]
MKAPTESALVRQLLQYLSLRGVLAWRANQIPAPLKGGGFRKFAGLKGVSDILGVLPPGGRLLAVEAKSPTGRLRPAQARFLDAVNARGGLGIVCRSLADLERGLAAEGITL